MANFYTKEQYENAQNQNIAHYLKSIGMEFNQNKNWLRSKDHSSLIIDESTGKWHWNSKNLHGNKPIELIKQLLINQGYNEKEAFIKAIKDLSDGTYSHTYVPPKKEPKPKYGLEIPKAKGYNNRVIAYLVKTRGIDYDIVKDMIAKGKIYETEKYGNVAFVSFDKKNNPRHIFLRGTVTSNEGKSFKSDVENSEKSYPFIMEGNKNAKWVMVFESAIDVLSHATIHKLQGRDIGAVNRIALHGISLEGLNRFLEDNPNVKGIIPALDNDKAGIRVNKKIAEEFEEKGYEIYKPSVPKHGKDFNDTLMHLRKEQQGQREKNLNNEKSNEIGDEELEN
jgi:5S rRNA maturation endonuclease (ribonuclease M5)